VVASALGAATEGGWWANVRARRNLAPESPEEIVRKRSQRYATYISAAIEGYKVHGDRSCSQANQRTADGEHACGRLFRIAIMWTTS
jgi:hypothetical protein